MKKIILLLILLSGACFSQTTNSARMLSAPNQVQSASYAFVQADSTRLTTFASAGDRTGLVAVTLAAGLTATINQTSIFSVQNLGPGTVTITCTGCLIFSNNSTGSATYSLSAGQGADLYTAGLNYIAQSGAGAGTGVVTSFNTRTGAVTPQTGDYTCAQVTGCGLTFNTVGQGGFIGAGFPFIFGFYPGATLSGGPVSTTSNQVSVFQFQLLATYTISKISMRVVTGAATSTANFGIYSSAGTKLIDSGAMSTATSASNQTVTLGTPVTLTPGTYYFAQSATTGAATVLGFALGIPATNPNIINLNATRTGQAANSTSSGVMPATLGTITADTVFANCAGVFFEI